MHVKKCTQRAVELFTRILLTIKQKWFRNVCQVNHKSVKPLLSPAKRTEPRKKTKKRIGNYCFSVSTGIWQAETKREKWGIYEWASERWANSNGWGTWERDSRLPHCWIPLSPPICVFIFQSIPYTSCIRWHTRRSTRNPCANTI